MRFGVGQKVPPIRTAGCLPVDATAGSANFYAAGFWLPLDWRVCNPPTCERCPQWRPERYRTFAVLGRIVWIGSRDLFLSVFSDWMKSC